LTTVTPAPRARVRAMKEYRPPLGSRDALRLDFNENTLACSPRVREALAQISAGSLTKYPEREPVEALVAAHLGIKPEQAALTNGVDEAIHVLFEAFLDAGDELLLPVPTYTRCTPRPPMRARLPSRRRTILRFRSSD
jgi:histidinol-phosphate aminotransferase